jgi:sec-independent protein translocase protein TatA
MLPFKLGAPELILILVIVVLLFGVGRIGKISGEIGTAIKNFRKGIKEDEEEGNPEAENVQKVNENKEE